MALARLSVQSKARRGEAVPVRLVIQHPMETGFQMDTQGRPVAKNLIRFVVCRYAGREVWRAELGSGIAANPYVEFSLRADMTGDIEMNWEDDLGEKGSVRARLDVA
ncbi:MAG: thiosulfate oxidation carrier complex protein SoxZ [Betaproteobacteria bacterium]